VAGACVVVGGAAVEAYVVVAGAAVVVTGAAVGVVTLKGAIVAAVVVGTGKVNVIGFCVVVA